MHIVSKFEEIIHEVPDSPQQLIINEIEKSTQLVFPPTVLRGRLDCVCTDGSNAITIDEPDPVCACRKERGIAGDERW